MKRAIPIRSFGRMFHPFDATGDDDAPFAPIDAGSLYYMRFGGTAPHLTRAGTGHAPVPRDPPAAPASGGADPADAPGQAITFATASTPVSAAAVSAAAVSASKVDSNAVLAMRADIASSTYKLSGAGIRIGILSDSFNLLGGATADTARGDLPSNVTILKEGTAGADEGRAMAELIHRVAPDAQIVFYSGTSSETDFANGILALKAAGCGVIVDDLLWMDEPFWQDGNVVQKAVEQVVASGVDYFTAAGNAGSNFYQAAFRPIRIALPGLFGTYYAAGFGAGNAARATESLSVAAGRTVTIELQWDQPYASIGSGHSSVNSLGMVLYDSKGRIVASAMANDVGRDPSQQLQFTNTTASTGFSLAVFVNGGSTLPGQFKFVAYGSGVTINDTAAGQGSGKLERPRAGGRRQHGRRHRRQQHAAAGRQRHGGELLRAQFRHAAVRCVRQPVRRAAKRRRGGFRGAGRNLDQRVRTVQRNIGGGPERRRGRGAHAAGQPVADAGADHDHPSPDRSPGQRRGAGDRCRACSGQRRGRPRADDATGVAPRRNLLRRRDHRHRRIGCAGIVGRCQGGGRGARQPRHRSDRDRDLHRRFAANADIAPGNRRLEHRRIFRDDVGLGYPPLRAAGDGARICLMTPSPLLFDQLSRISSRRNSLPRCASIAATVSPTSPRAAASSATGCPSRCIERRTAAVG